MLTKPEILALEWQVWPLRQHGLRPRALAVLLLATLVWLVLLVSLPLLAALGLGLALLASLLPYYLPTRYKVTAEGVTVSRVIAGRLRRWNEFAHCEAKSAGFLLNPATSPNSRLTIFRAVWLPLPSDTTVQALLRSLLLAHLPLV